MVKGEKRRKCATPVELPVITNGSISAVDSVLNPDRKNSFIGTKPLRSGRIKFPSHSVYKHALIMLNERGSIAAEESGALSLDVRQED